MSSPVLKRMASLYPATSGGETGVLSCSGGRPRAAILRSAHSGVAQLAERRTVNPQVVGSSPTPGAAVTSGCFLEGPAWRGCRRPSGHRLVTDALADGGRGGASPGEPLPTGRRNGCQRELPRMTLSVSDLPTCFDRRRHLLRGRLWCVPP